MSCEENSQVNKQICSELDVMVGASEATSLSEKLVAIGPGSGEGVSSPVPPEDRSHQVVGGFEGKSMQKTA